MLLVIVFLIYNWNTYYRNRENVVLVNEIQPYGQGIEVFTRFCQREGGRNEARMMCLVSRETLRNNTSLQGRLCGEKVGHGAQDSGKPCLRYSTYSIHQSCESENATCSLMLLPAVQDGVCDERGTCDRDFSVRTQGDKHQFGATFLEGRCTCR